MGILSGVKRFGRAIGAALGIGQGQAIPNPVQQSSDSEKVTLFPQSTARYRHVSAPVGEDEMMMARFFGNARVLRSMRGRGTTYNVGINAMKNRIRALPKRARRAARTAFIHELRAAGIK